jgi:hypothetical protein
MVAETLGFCPHGRRPGFSPRRKLNLAEVVACTSVVCNYITRSPIHLDDHNITQEKTMTTQLSTKLTALALALMVNSVMIGGVAFLFSARIHQQVMTALAQVQPAAAAPTI